MVLQRILGYLFTILLGILVGLLVNLLADSLPLRRAPDVPRCPACREIRPLRAWLGVAALLSGQRHCPACNEPLPYRHVIIEVTLSLAYSYLWMRYLGSHLTVIEFPIFSLYLTVFALVVVIDLEHRLVLNVVLFPAIAFALIDAAFFGRLTLRASLLGGAVGFAIVFGIYAFGAFFAWTVRRARGEPPEEVVFGVGDVTLATFSGLVVGYPRIILALMLMVFAGGIVAGLFLLYRLFIRRDYHPFTAIAYGPYIVFGALVMLLWADEIRVLAIGS